MPDTHFEDWDSLVEAVESKAEKILKDDVSTVAEALLKQHIKSDIYDVYTPHENAWVNGSTYQRRHVLEESITSFISDKNTLLITSTANASLAVVSGWSFQNRYPGAFLKLLESGNMGIWRQGFPRPAVSNTQNEIDGSPQIKSAIRNGIKREIGVCIEI